MMSAENSQMNYQAGEALTEYSSEFFSSVDAGAIASARVVVPHVVSLLSPRSVVDIGCGRGGWLRVLKDGGCSRVLGVDGNYVDTSTIHIDCSEFLPQNLEHLRPGSVGAFDLAMCLEVAEHLPSRCSQQLVEVLCEAAPAVLFSAAIPGQGGTRHINEQWPPYWRERFAACGFERFDILRPRILTDCRVEWWYRQNLYFFVRSGTAEHKALSDAVEDGCDSEMEIIYSGRLASFTSFRGLLRELIVAARRTANRLFKPL